MLYSPLAYTYPNIPNFYRSKMIASSIYIPDELHHGVNAHSVFCFYVGVMRPILIGLVGSPPGKNQGALQIAGDRC